MNTIELTQWNKVKNIGETRLCGPTFYDSWKQFWIDNTSQNWPKECRVSGCTKQAYCGGHVYIKVYEGVYIIPLCRSCNNRYNTSWMAVNTGTIAVLVVDDDTYGPREICS